MILGSLGSQSEVCMQYREAMDGWVGSPSSLSTSIFDFPHVSPPPLPYISPFTHPSGGPAKQQ